MKKTIVVISKRAKKVHPSFFPTFFAPIWGMMWMDFLLEKGLIRETVVTYMAPHVIHYVPTKSGKQRNMTF